MTHKLPDYQTIEEAFKAANEVIAKLPDSTEARSAKRNLEVAQKLTFEARERAKTASLAIDTRGPAMAGWGWPHPDGLCP